MILKRIFDIILSLSGILILSPLLIIIAVCISLCSSGGVFYKQIRVGKDGVAFKLLKFRTMVKGADQHGLLSLGHQDPRILPIGRWLRKHKLDELPQLFNILLGHMSVVGPRPEVPRYVEEYSAHQRNVLLVRPGLTDYASILYFDEGEQLADSADPEKTYIEKILPKKLELGLAYASHPSLKKDLHIIGLTLKRILLGRDLR